MSQNQLDLFTGDVSLNDEQLEKLNSYLENNEKSNEFRRFECVKKVKILDDAGWVKDVDYEVDINSSMIDENIKIGSFSDFIIVKKSIPRFIYNIKVNYKYYSTYNNKLVDTYTTLDFDNGKIQAFGLTDNWRYYKPSSLLVKLKEKIENEQLTYDLVNKRTEKFNKLIERYSAVEGVSEVVKDTHYDRFYKNSTPCVLVKMENGSWMKISEHERMIAHFNSKIANSAVPDVIEIVKYLAK